MLRSLLTPSAITLVTPICSRCLYLSSAWLVKQNLPQKPQIDEDETVKPKANMQPREKKVIRAHPTYPQKDPKQEQEERERWAENKIETDPKAIIAADVNWWSKAGERSKDSFLDRCEQFTKTVTKHRHGQVEFIYAALRHMKDFGVHKDLQAYKGVMDVLPKELMKPTNIFQTFFFHFMKQQSCAIEILHQMELN